MFSSKGTSALTKTRSIAIQRAIKGKWDEQLDLFLEYGAQGESMFVTRRHHREIEKPKQDSDSDMSILERDISDKQANKGGQSHECWCPQWTVGIQ